MADQDRLRQEYLHRVCAALVEYVDRGNHLRVHSHPCEEGLKVTFTINDPNLYHALCEDHPPAPPPDPGLAA